LSVSDGDAAGDAKAGLVSGSIGFASRMVSQALVLGVTLVAARLLTIAEFGALAIASALFFLARNLLYVGAYEYLLKSPAAPRLAANCLAANGVVATITVGCLALFALASGHLFGTDDIALLLLALLPSIFVVALTSWNEALLLRAGHIRAYYLANIAAEVLGAAVAVGTLLAGLGILSLVAQTYTRLGLLLLAYLAMQGRRGMALAAPARADIAEVIGWSGRRYLAAFLNFGFNQGADMVLGILMSPAAAGLFRGAHRIVHALADLFVQPLLKLAQVQVSGRVARGEGPGAAWLSMFTGVAAIAWAALAGLAATADRLVPLVLGPHWAAAAPVVVVLCAVRALSLVDSVSTPVLVASDRQRFMLRVQVGASAGVLGASALVASAGPAAVAAATGLVALVLTLLYLDEARRLSGIARAEIVRAIALAALPALLVGAAVEAVLVLGPAEPPLALLLAAGLAAAVLGLLLLRGPVRSAMVAMGGGPMTPAAP
jgi:O-antigen/teichoic acid export membrane protein